MTLNFQPKEVFKFFEDISKIPRGSGNEKEITNYLVDFAKERNLEVFVDDWLNVIIKKDATQGYEDAPVVIIQGHTDMVCEKNEDKKHDFEKDPISLVVDGDIIRADNTTLGADNGVAVAMGLALLDSKDIPHPPLEVVLTSQEEIGLIGANNIDASELKGKIFLNIDTAEEGYFVTSCAGGITATINLEVDLQELPKDYIQYELFIYGLKGGHSGMEINKQRGNATVLLGRTINHLMDKMDLLVGNINGGLKQNAITREAKAIIAIKETDIHNLKREIEELENIYKDECKITDKNLKMTLKENTNQVKMYSKKDSLRVLSTICLLPNGVVSKSLEIPNLVETSANLGVVTTIDNIVEFKYCMRSNVESKKNYLKQKVLELVKLIDGNVCISGDYPAWQYNPSSPIREIFVKVYKKHYGKEPIVTALHAGLECGVFSKKIPGIDLISFGPDIFNAHTPEESMSASSIKNVWDMLVSALGELNKI